MREVVIRHYVIAAGDLCDQILDGAGRDVLNGLASEGEGVQHLDGLETEGVNGEVLDGVLLFLNDVEWAVEEHLLGFFDVLGENFLKKFGVFQVLIVHFRLEEETLEVGAVRPELPYALLEQLLNVIVKAMKHCIDFYVSQCLILR